MSRRCHWGHGIAAVYTLFALGTASVVIFAMRQPVDLVSDDYYAQAVALDGRRAAEANVRALRDAFAIDATDDGHAVTIRWPLRTTAGMTPP